jgi:hypothetical protein
MLGIVSSYDVPLSYSNSLWRFRSSDSTWAWIAGYSTSVPTTSSFPGSYGVKGVAASGNVPPARVYTSTAVYGNSLFMFGGCKASLSSSFPVGTSVTFGDFRNDLWKFNTSQGQWSWISGSSITDISGVYNDSFSNPAMPGSRCDLQAFLKMQNQAASMYFFGGYGYDGSGSLKVLNDLWQFNILTQTWKWISGNSIGNSIGSYGVKGVTTISNLPASRKGFLMWCE